MNDTFNVNHHDYFSLCSRINHALRINTDILASRLKDLDNDNTDFISKAACRISAFDLRLTLLDLDNILQAALDIAPDDIHDFFTHYNERQLPDPVVAADGTPYPF